MSVNPQDFWISKWEHKKKLLKDSGLKVMCVGLLAAQCSAEAQDVQEW